MILGFSERASLVLDKLKVTAKMGFYSKICDGLKRV
jgi:hypothetical protein